VQFQPINADFLGRDELQNLAYVRDEIKTMWPSLERFGEKGFGVAALLEETVIGWCTAEYASEGQCGIGIATVSEFENKGVATAMAARFVEICLQRHLTPHWECNSRNPGSVRVAEKVGFELIQEGTFWIGAFQHEQN
jgi:RimJ/RimL family protein N-acetyltransferase